MTWRLFNKESKDGAWRYLHIKVKLWPGQTKLIEETFKERVVQTLIQSNPDYAPWMYTVTGKVS